jgi:predicted esterase
MTLQQIKVNKTAFIAIEGNKNPSCIWLVLHGYGQLASYFIKKFNSLNKERNLVIVPEALSKYYISGNNGRVGATWMTKHERETEIEDNHNFLDTVYSKFIPKNYTGKIVLLGFSQGAATAARWLSTTEHTFHHLILWASVFPPDLKMDEFKQKQVKTTLVFGDNDEYLSKDDIESHHKWAQENLVDVELLMFEGNHNISPDVLKKLEQEILSL